VAPSGGACYPPAMPSRPRDPLATRAAEPPTPRMSFLAGLFALVITLPFIPSVSGDGDAGEFALVLARFGAAHPTGYPVYTLAGGAFVHAMHALGAPWAWSANVWSALGGAVAVGLLHALSARLMAREGSSAFAANIGGLVSAAVLVAHPVWIRATTQAEVHSWHVAWTLGILLLALALTDSRALPGTPAAEPAGRVSRLERPGGAALAWGGLVGLGLAHHATSVLTSGPLTLAIAIGARRRWRWQALPLAVAAALVPLLAYGFIAWRAFHPTAGQWATLGPNWPSVLEHLTGKQYRVYVAGFSPSPEDRALLTSGIYPWLAATLPALVFWALAARGASAACRVGFVAAAGSTLGFIYRYGVSDPSAYFLGPLAISLAVVPAALGLLPGARRIARPVAVAAALAVAVELAFGARAGLRRARMFSSNEALLHRLWRAVPVECGFVIWTDDRIALLLGYQILGGEKPGLEVVAPVQLSQDWPRARFIARHGFDPVSRADIAAEAGRVHPRNVSDLRMLLSRVIEMRINAQSPLPVVRFRPEVPDVQVLAKPTAPKR
jgi:Protein of unknown function (DUF2723)